MAIKLISVDMDGTFLDDSMQYDRPRFAALKQRMDERGIRFVIASGNQFFQLRSYFEDYDDIIYIAENGAFVTDQKVDYLTSTFTDDEVTATLERLAELPQILTLLSGRKSAYVLDSTDALYRAVMAKYYYRLETVDSFDAVDDQILKLALTTPRDETVSIAETLRATLNGIAVPTSSGHGSIDLIKPGIHKGHALAHLGGILGIEPADMVAFGDGGNDLEMLQLVGRGVAMANAPEPVKAVADDLAASNNDQGVLAYLEQLGL